jgi:hypothetical protein
MSPGKRVIARTLLVSLIFVGSITAALAAQSSSSILGRSSYSADQVEIQQVSLAEDGKVKITFRVMAETVWYCPGADAATKKDRIELTFVRAWFKKTPKVTCPTVADKGHQSIVVEAKGKPLFIKSGKKWVELRPEE